MCCHVSILSYVGYQVINSLVYPTIYIYIWVLKSASINSGLCWSLGSSHNSVPKSQHWLGFIKVFFVLFPKHKPLPNISIMTSPDSILCEVAPVHIGIFTCSEYSSKKISTVYYSDINDIVHMFLPRIFVTAWLSIFVEHASQCICFCFLEVSSLNFLDPVSIWNTSDCKMWQ